MYNTELPNRWDLPTSAQLMRSTVLALASAVVILVAVVLPAEYGIDFTGIGRPLGLTKMGEIKMQLAREAAADAATPAPPPATPQSRPAPRPENLSKPDEIATVLPPRQPPAPPVVAPAPTSRPQPEVATRTEPPLPPTRAQEAWRHQISIVLAPGQGAEVKLVMNAGAQAQFEWSANGSVLNFDTHGDGGGRSISYHKGRGVAEDKGTIRAEFDGNHGWFWRNRTNSSVTLTLRTRGSYFDLKRMV